MKQQAFHTSHYPITGISRESLLIFCLKTVTVQHLHSYKQKRSVFRFQSYLPQTACQTVFQSVNRSPCHCIFRVLLFVTTFFKTYYIYLSRVSEDCQVDSRSSLYLHIKISPIISIVKIFISAYNTWEHLIIGVPQKFVILLTENTSVL